MNRIQATYRIETRYPLEQAASIMAGEQSNGTFLKVPGETRELTKNHGARVEQISEREPPGILSLPGSRPPRGDASSLKAAEVVLSFPIQNIGNSLINLMTMLSGNLYELSPFSGLRLTGIEIPESFANAFPGPAFGIEGTRRLSGVKDRPLVGTIIKPSVGLSPEQTAKMVKTFCTAGLDFIKDDELIANAPYSTVRNRVRAVMEVINEHREQTGKTVLYACNISDEIESMRRHHDEVLSTGGNCVMVSLISVGLAGVQALRRHSQLPIHGHRNGWGALSRHPALGFDYTAWQQFWKLAGVDHLHVNGLQNKFCEPDSSVIESAKACLSGIHGRFQVMPVFSSGQWAKQAFETFTQLGCQELLYVCGGGIIGHPDGIEAGVRSIQQAWRSAAGGLGIEDALADPENREFKSAMEFFERITG